MINILHIYKGCLRGGGCKTIFPKCLKIFALFDNNIYQSRGRIPTNRMFLEFVIDVKFLYLCAKHRYISQLFIYQVNIHKLIYKLVYTFVQSILY